MHKRNIINKKGLPISRATNHIQKGQDNYMTFEELKKVNESLLTTDIKGKAYTDVSQRIKGFRMLYPNGCISTEIVSDENGRCTIKASVFNEDGKLLATGYSYEKENSTFINKTSYIENCETSAVGRALGMLGIGIDTSVASKDEVETAMINQIDFAGLTDKEKTKLIDGAKAKGHILTQQDVKNYIAMQKAKPSDAEIDELRKTMFKEEETF